MRPRNVVLEGDALTVLRTLAPAQFHAAITSPPYYRLRRYEAGPQELGTEAHIDQWVGNLRAVSREIQRVLTPDGNYWLNVGDAYSGGSRFGAPRKSLLLGPERLIRALLADGWIVRGRICWAKSTPLPSPVGDRLTNAWEHIFHLTRAQRYWFDLDAVRVPLKSKPKPAVAATSLSRAALGELAGPRAGLAKLAAEGRSGHPLGRNPTDHWTLPPGRRVGGHHAVFPEALVRRPILATVPPVVCINCGRAWRRSTQPVRFLGDRPQPRPFVACGCHAATEPGRVLDPFAGSGTTLKVARDLRRDAVGIELKPEYAALARQRAGFDQSWAEAA